MGLEDGACPSSSATSDPTPISSSPTTGLLHHSPTRRPLGLCRHPGQAWRHRVWQHPVSGGRRDQGQGHTRQEGLGGNAQDGSRSPRRAGAGSSFRNCRTRHGSFWMEREVWRMEEESLDC